MNTNTFKIVATREKRGVYFTAIPHKWEKNKVLFWPEHLSNSKRESLRQDATSKPDSKWMQYPCILKFQQIDTFTKALEYEKQFEKCADTDAEEELFIKLKTSAQYVDLNNIFEESSSEFSNSEEQMSSKSSSSCFLVAKQRNLGPSATSSTEPVNIPLNEEPLCREDNSCDVSPIKETTAEGSQITLDWNSFIPDNDILDIKKELKDIKTEIMDFKAEFASMKSELKTDYKKASVLFEEVIKKLDFLGTDENFGQRKQLPVEVEEDYLKMFSFPLQTLSEVNALEDEIRNKDSFRQQLTDFLGKIGGTTGQNDAAKVVYKIADTLFSTEILTHYSWTGISKKKELAEKHSFAALKKIVEVFFDVLTRCDNRHTKEKNEKILRDGVLKHAKKRYERRCQQKEVKGSTVVTETETDAEVQAESDTTQIPDVEIYIDRID